MLVTELNVETELFHGIPLTKKMRDESQCSAENSHVLDSTIRNLELDGVKELFQDYDLKETEEVACVICGKHYKSKVCVKKHLWEHSIYWDMFDGLKKQQRVLSIQAAIILSIKFNPSLSLLLVTQSSNKKKSIDKSGDKVIVDKNNQRKRKLENLTTQTSFPVSTNYKPTLQAIPSLDITCV
ncbi:uncharacterized protein LOC100208428 [Hydra vulgaris]|uniref:Uncharacterized protein LOC100208428 n=1 Tax=Hydra vulgaris TaxID=6087 RepID=A0ABM4B703_HYDVU